MTLNDRFRNEEFKVEDRHVDEDDAETQRYSLSADELRVRRVFIHLTSLCQTEEARESLMVCCSLFSPCLAPVLLETWMRGRGK